MLLQYRKKDAPLKKAPSLKGYSSSNGKNHSENASNTNKGKTLKPALWDLDENDHYQNYDNDDELDSNYSNPRSSNKKVKFQKFL